MEEGGRIGVVGWAMKAEMTAQLVIIPASRDVCFRVEAKFASMADMRRKAVVHVAADVSRLWVMVVSSAGANELPLPVFCGAIRSRRPQIGADANPRPDWKLATHGGTKAARRMTRKFLKNQGCSPHVLISDEFASSPGGKRSPKSPCQTGAIETSQCQL
jgi:hypothetical protein